MPTNENLSAELVKNIITAGYTPRTPEEWIMSALNYLDQEAVVPPIGGGGGSGDFKADGSVAMTGKTQYAVDNTVDIGSATFAPRDAYVSRDLFTDSIKEKTIDSGITLGVTPLSTGNITLATDATGQGAITISGRGGVTLGNGNVAGAGVTIHAGGAGSTLELRALGAGSDILVSSIGGSISLTPSLGWTACTGTESKAGIDSDNVIFTVGALQDLARAIAAIQNTLMTKGYLTT